MRRFERFRSSLPQLSNLVIILSLLVIGVVMHGWFTRSAESEIQNARRNLYGPIIQTVGREFQRYGLFFGEFEAINRGPALTEEQARNFLERTIKTWGPQGSVPGLLHSAALGRDFLPPPPLGKYSLLRDNGRFWQESGNIGYPLPQNLMLRLSDSDMVIAPLVMNNGFGTILLVGRAGKSSHLLLFLVIEGQEFYDTWLQPALATIIPDATLTLKAANPRSGDPENRDFGPEPATGFNPLASLLGFRSRGNRQLDFPLPRFIDFYRSAIAPPGPGNGTNPPHFQITPRADRLRPTEHGGILSLEFKPGSSLDSLEFRLALNWLGGMSLLAGLGIAFFLVVHQANRLRESRRREREFVAAITHELRTPLTVIQSCADNLAGGIVNSDRLKSYGELIREQSHRLGRMIEDVLRFAGVEGRPDLLPRLVTIFPADLLSGLRAGLDALASARSLTLHWKLDALPASCRSDPDTLRLVLENLIVNAIIHAYTEVPNGQIRIAGGTIGKTKLWLSVEDDGRGIPHAEAGHVFDPFFRGKSSRNNQETGAGLGLHLARRTARILGGDIKLESPYRRPDGSRHQGCRFTLVLPLLMEENEDD